MREDEYNIVKINNDGKKSFGEFGKIQKNEFTSFKENKTSAKPNGLNDDHTKNDSVIENTGLGEAPKYNGKDQDLINQASNATTSAATSTAASTASTVSTTVATAASVIAVTTVAATTGIAVVTNNNASAELTKFRITSNQMTYALTLRDCGEDPFVISVENANYQSVRPLHEGINEGIFSGLTLGQTYNVYVREDTLAGKTILSEVFTTYTNSEFLKFNFDKSANFQEEYFEIKMDFEDADDIYSDFEFYLEDSLNPEVNYTYILEKTNEVQRLSTNIPDEVRFDLFKSEFNYKFTFKEDGNLIEYDSGTVKFIDTTESKEEFRSFEFVDNKANFLTYSFDVKLDFDDDLNRYSELILTMTDTEDETKTQSFELNKTSEVQTLTSSVIETADGGPGGYVLDVRHSTFNYSFSFKDNGELIEFKSGTIKFNDSTNSVSEVRGLIWDKSANFLTYTTEVQLDYQDDFDYFEDFTLTFKKVGGSEREVEEFSLTKNTEVQSLFFHQDQAGYQVDVRHGSYTATLKYFSKETNEYITIDYEEFEFTDNSGAISAINSFTWDEKVNFNDLSFSVTLDLQDDLEVIDNIRLVVTETDENNPGESKTFLLEETNATQDLNFNYNDQGEMVETSLDIPTGTFEYQLLYDYEGEEVEFVKKENVSFQNSISSEFYNFNFDYVLYEDNMIYFKLDMDNTAGEYGEMKLVLTPVSDAQTGDSESTGSSVTPIANTIQADTQWQSLAYDTVYINRDDRFTIQITAVIFDAKNPDDQNPEVRTLFTSDEFTFGEYDGSGHVYGGRADEYQSFSSSEQDPIFRYTPYYELGNRSEFGSFRLRIETSSGNTYDYEIQTWDGSGSTEREIHLNTPAYVNGEYTGSDAPSINILEEIGEDKPVRIELFYETFEDDPDHPGSQKTNENVMVTHESYVFYIY